MLTGKMRLGPIRAKQFDGTEESARELRLELFIGEDKKTQYLFVDRCGDKRLEYAVHRGDWCIIDEFCQRTVMQDFLFNKRYVLVRSEGTDTPVARVWKEKP